MKPLRVLVPLLAMTAAFASVPALAATNVVTVAADGHATNPVWYHDTAAVQVGSSIDVAWNTNSASVQARSFSAKTGSALTGPINVSASSLDCLCTDSTGTNPNRHDVPSLFADPAGRVYALYGGGTTSRTGTQTGPYYRPAAGVGSVTKWGAEQRLAIPGSAYDFEVVRDNHGVNHIFGQEGDNPAGAGSLVYMKLSPGTSTAVGKLQPYHVLVRGGYDSAACAWRVTPGCNIYVIGRVAVGPANPKNTATPSPLYLTWGWSEAGLSASCGDPAGFCNHGLYMAVSYDAGTTWSNVDKSASTNVTSSPIAYNDSRYAVVDAGTDVGLFKAIAVTGAYPGRPWIAYQPGADQAAGKITVVHRAGTSWATQVVDSTRAWNNHLVMRSTSTGHVYLWSDIAQSGTHASEIVQWVGSVTSSAWFKSYLTVGANWFLSGTPVPGGELLMWRVPQSATATSVAFQVVATT